MERERKEKDAMTLGERVAALEAENKQLRDGLASNGQYVIVRTRDAGVHAGVMTSMDGDVVTI